VRRRQDAGRDDADQRQEPEHHAVSAFRSTRCRMVAFPGSDADMVDRGVRRNGRYSSCAFMAPLPSSAL
jgi:hypothetical protein